MNRFYVERAGRGLTQQEVADGAGISRATVTALETRRDPRPHADTVSKLADFYKISVAELLGVDAASEAA